VTIATTEFWLSVIYFEIKCVVIWSPETHFERNTQQTNEQKNIRFGVAKEETFLAFFDATTKRMDGKNQSTE